MRFGLSLFGGAASGLVIAAGLTAACGAQVDGQSNVTRLGAGNAASQAVVTGAGKRTANNKVSTLIARATASGNARNNITASPLSALARATASGQAKAFFYVAGSVSAYAQIQGSPFRQARGYGLPAKATAALECYPETWQVGEASPAMAFAYGYGTWHHIGHGNALAFAQANGLGLHTHGAIGEAAALAAATGFCVLTHGAEGLAECSAKAFGDAAVKKGGVRYLAANGSAICTAEAQVLTVSIYQPQIAECVAELEGTAYYILGGAGNALATAIAGGDAEVIQTAATADHAHTSAAATGAAKKWANAIGNGVATATGFADPEVKQTAVEAMPGVCTATVSGDAVRICQAEGLGLATSTWNVVYNKITFGELYPAKATATLFQYQVGIGVTPQPAACDAVVSGDGQRIAVAEGVPAQATATGHGANQVNDLVPAPVSRRMVVPVISRVVPVPFVSRTIYVAA